MIIQQFVPTELRKRYQCGNTKERTRERGREGERDREIEREVDRERVRDREKDKCNLKTCYGRDGKQCAAWRWQKRGSRIHVREHSLWKCVWHIVLKLHTTYTQNQHNTM